MVTIVIPDESNIIIKNDNDSVIGKYIQVFDNSYIVCVSEEIPRWTSLMKEKMRILTEPFEVERENSLPFPIICVLAQAKDGKIYRIKYDRLWIQ